MRGALADLAGGIRARSSVRSRASSVRGRVGELIGLADELCAEAGLTRGSITQTVIGSPGVYDPRRNAMALTGELPGWDRPAVLERLREAFGHSLAVENDVDAAALAERALGCGREADSFAFISVGTGIGMGLVLGGQLVRGAHGVAGEIAYMPMSGGAGTDPEDARRRGALEASASASAVVRAARRAGMRGQVSARRVFAAAARGDERAAAVVAEEARLVARLLCAVVTVIDPGLIVLGGGIGQAPGFAAAVTSELRELAPVMPEVSVSALGTEAVVDGCLAAGTELAWAQLTATVPPAGRDGQLPGPDGRADGPGRLPVTGGLMAAEMASQPEVLARLVARAPADTAAVRAVVPRPLAGVVFLARGSSDNAAVFGRYLAELCAGQAGLAAPSLYTRYHADVNWRGYLMVALSQSGATPEIISTCRAVRSAGATVIGITNEPGSPLADAVDLVLPTEAGPELAVPATKTVTAQLAVLVTVAAALGTGPAVADTLAGLPAAVDAILGRSRGRP